MSCNSFIKPDLSPLKAKKQFMYITDENIRYLKNWSYIHMLDQFKLKCFKNLIYNSQKKLICLTLEKIYVNLSKSAGHTFTCTTSQSVKVFYITVKKFRIIY